MTNREFAREYLTTAAGDAGLDLEHPQVLEWIETHSIQLGDEIGATIGFFMAHIATPMPEYMAR